MKAPDSGMPGGGRTAAAKATWRERWISWRNRRLSDPSFQRWASAFRPTRGVARGNARALFDLVAGFVYSQTLYACVSLEVFEKLSAAPLFPSDLAPIIHLSDEATLRLLRAAAALNLLEKLPDGRFALGPLGAALLGNPSLRHMIRHHARLYADLTDPVALLRGEIANSQLGGFWPYAASSDPARSTRADTVEYSALMAESQAIIADQILDACSMMPYRHLLDVGGGAGAFLSAAGARFPHLQLSLFDLPAVAAQAGERFSELGIGERAAVFGGDFLRDELPPGADIVSLVRVLHDHNDEAALALLRRIRGILPPGGTLMIAEPMAGTRGAEPAGDAYFGLYLAAMGSGRPRRADEIAAMLSSAGFSRSWSVPTHVPLLASVLVARV